MASRHRRECTASRRPPHHPQRIPAHLESRNRREHGGNLAPEQLGNTKPFGRDPQPLTRRTTAPFAVLLAGCCPRHRRFVCSRTAGRKVAEIRADTNPSLAGNPIVFGVCGDNAEKPAGDPEGGMVYISFQIRWLRTDLRPDSGRGRAPTAASPRISSVIARHQSPLSGSHFHVPTPIFSARIGCGGSRAFGVAPDPVELNAFARLHRKILRR